MHSPPSLAFSTSATSPPVAPPPKRRSNRPSLRRSRSGRTSRLPFVLIRRGHESTSKVIRAGSARKRTANESGALLANASRRVIMSVAAVSSQNMMPKDRCSMSKKVALFSPGDYRSAPILGPGSNRRKPPPESATPCASSAASLMWSTVISTPPTRRSPNSDRSTTLDRRLRPLGLRDSHG